METAPHLVPTDEWRSRAIAARKAKGWSQRELADRIGGSQPSVSQIESGSRDGAERSPYVAMMSQELGISDPYYGDSSVVKDVVAYADQLEKMNPEQLSLIRALMKTAVESQVKSKKS
jgi:transcriptional regulator with XRE-family HTH domain